MKFALGGARARLLHEGSNRMDAEIPEKLDTGDPLSLEQILQHFPQLGESDPEIDPKTKQPKIDEKTGLPKGKRIYSDIVLKQYTGGAAVARQFSAGDIVCHEGDFGATAFYIVSGHVEIYIDNPLASVKSRSGGGGFFGMFGKVSSFLGKNESGPAADQGFITIDASVDLPKTTPLAFLGAGELFGEMTCRTFQPRSATVRASDDCVMVEMLRVVLDMLMGTREVDTATKANTKVKMPTFRGTSFKKQMDEKYRERSLVNHLKSVPLFATLTLEAFEKLKNTAELVSFGKNEIICKQHQPADAFYLIRTGLVRVSQKMPLIASEPRTYYLDKVSKREYWLQPDASNVEDELVRTYLKRGEFFGEIGLLMDQPRNATCSAMDSVDVVKIERALFEEMLSEFPIVRATLQQVAKVRIEAAKERKVPEGVGLDEFITQGLFEAQNLLLIDLDNCTRCDACVNACADAHDGVTRLIRDGLRYDHFLVATACRSCRDPLCMTQCPVGSIRRKESLEIIIEDWCIGCTKCAELCPYGNINMVDFRLGRKELAEKEKKEKEAKAKAEAARALAAKNEAVKTDAEKEAAVKAEAAKAAAAKSAEPSVKVLKKVEKKMPSVTKATTCDLCTHLSMPSCVYACPHNAAKRVEPTAFLAKQIGARGGGQRMRWLGDKNANRTTH